MHESWLQNPENSFSAFDSHWTAARSCFIFCWTFCVSEVPEIRPECRPAHNSFTSQDTFKLLCPKLCSKYNLISRTQQITHTVWMGCWLTTACYHCSDLQAVGLENSSKSNTINIQGFKPSDSRPVSLLITDSVGPLELWFLLLLQTTKAIPATSQYSPRHESKFNHVIINQLPHTRFQSLFVRGRIKSVWFSWLFCGFAATSGEQPWT